MVTKMIVDTAYLRTEILKIWPYLKSDDLIFWDQKYWLIPEAQIGLLLEKSMIPEMDFIREFNDCDNYALQFQAETRRKRYLSWKNGNLPREERYPVAISLLWGTKWRGMSKNHKGNLFGCPEGIYIADSTPMERRYWKATAENDHPLKINFA